MDKDAYASLIDQVDREFQAAKTAALETSRRQATEFALKMIRIQRQGLQAKLAAFAKLGIRPSVDLPGIIDSLKGEELLIEKELASSEPASPIAPPASPPPPNREETLEDLLAEIAATAFSGLDYDHASVLLRTWALRWRIVLDRMGPRARDDRGIRLAYARIRNAAQGYPKPLPYLHALREGSTGDWEGDLEVSLEELHRQGLRPRSAAPTKKTDWRWRDPDPWQQALLDIAIEQKIVPAVAS